MPKSLLDPKSLSTHIDAVRALARTLLGDEQDAEDVAQDAAVIALETTVAVRSPRGWFAGLGRNLSHRRIRDRQRQRKREHAVARSESANSDAAELMHRATEQRRLLDHLLKLENPYRDVLLLRFFEDLPPREIAKRRNTPVETVRTQVRRGIERLRERLETELRVDGRTWQQGLSLAAGVGAHVGKRAPGALAAKAAIAAGVLLAVGATAWWGIDLLSSEADDPSADIHLASDKIVGGDAADQTSEASVGLKIPEWVQPAGEDRADGERQAKHKEPPTRTVTEAETSAPRRRTVTPVAPAAPDVEPVTGPISHASRTTEPIRATMRSTDGGMVLLPAAHVWFGSPDEWTSNFSVAGENRTLIGALWETPTFRREVDEVYIDKHEVTNAQYELYLQDVGKVEDYKVGSIRLDRARSLSDVIDKLWGPQKILFDRSRAIQQLYYVNAAVLIQAMPQLVIRTDEGDIDHDATRKAFENTELKRGIPLRFYARPIPPTWEGMAPRNDERDHPVSGLSFAEALNFAQWAGKHIPSEFHWEYAARGRNGSPWPWGADPIDFDERVNGGFRRRRGDVPRTMPVHFLPQGRSTFGCFHMLGNVAEWTSSLPLEYPALTKNHGFDSSRVIRGGSAKNVVQGAVRAMFRGWEEPLLGLDERSQAYKETPAVPRPEALQRVPWTGFRCAWYEDVGRSLIESMAHRFEMHADWRRSLLDDRHWAALMSINHAADGSVVAEGRFVQGPSHGIAIQPLRQAVHIKATKYGANFFWSSKGEDAPRVLSDANLINLQELRSALVQRMLVLGLFHTDFPITERASRVLAKEGRDWYGDKDRTGTFLVLWDGSNTWLEHFVTGQRYQLRRSTEAIREGGDQFSEAQPKVTLKAPHLKQRLSGSAEIRMMIPYSSATDSQHLLLDVSFRLDLERPPTELAVRPLKSGGK